MHNDFGAFWPASNTVIVVSVRSQPRVEDRIEYVRLRSLALKKCSIIAVVVSRDIPHVHTGRIFVTRACVILREKQLAALVNKSSERVYNLIVQCSTAPLEG